VSGWNWLDPIVSLLLSIVVLASTWSLLRRALDLALDAVPEGIHVDHIDAFLRGLPAVVEVHDLHVWAMSTTENLLTAHLVVSTPTDDEFLSHACDELHARFKIGHATLQIERSTAAACRLAPEEVV